MTKQKNSGMMSEDMKEKLATLSERERKYFMSMWPKSGVLYITAKPGVAKSAIAKSIATKMGFHYEDIRLSMADETDFKFPFLSDEQSDGEKIKVSGYAVPDWAFKANQQKTIIHFEELNRAPLFVRNAALQILLERQIGSFKFNDNVLMMASGNLGEEDGTDVEEFDAALNNRLLHYHHTLGADEWIQNFAEENVHPLIVSFIKNYKEKLYQPPTENTKAYATPRSWTFLSDQITKNFGFDSDPREFMPYVQEIAHSIIGNSAQRFITYCQDMINISIKDILDRYDKVKGDIEKYNRDKKSELLQSLKEYKLVDLNEKQLKNAAAFLKTISDDEMTSYLLYVVDYVKDTKNPKVKEWLKSNFTEALLSIKQHNNNQD